MAPVTRRRTKALESSQPDSSFLSDADADTSSLANTPSLSQPPSRQRSQESTPKTSRANPGRPKRKSTDAADSSSSSQQHNGKAETTPKRKRLAVRTRVEESPQGDHRAVHIEATIPISSILNTDEANEDDDEEGGPEPESATKQLQEEASWKNTSQPAGAPKSKHVVFGDDDDVDNFVAVATAKDAKRRQESEDEDEASGSDSDDDAPEAVSTAAAAKQTKKAEQAAADAVEK